MPTDVSPPSPAANSGAANSGAANLGAVNSGAVNSEAVNSGAEPFRTRRRVGWWLALLVFYWLALLAATHVPLRAARRIEHADKVGHFVAYAILAALLYATGRLMFRQSFWLVFAIFALIAVYATLDEWLQTFVPRRTADIYDWCADLAGAATALALCRVRSQFPSRRG
ncbi:MAG: VanZ family protein [Planctomycetota bacterium]